MVCERRIAIIDMEGDGDKMLTDDAVVERSELKLRSDLGGSIGQEKEIRLVCLMTGKKFCV